MDCHSGVTHVLVPSAVLTASLLGSGHCALMCGGLVMSAARSAWQHFLYHSGRLAAYAGLGFISGTVGENVMTQLPQGVSAAAAWAVALSFVALGWMGWKKGGLHLPVPGADKINTWTVRLFRSLTDPAKPGRHYYAALIGALSIFLPCGWLYSFVLASVTMADPLKGAGLMAVFWAGTLPALVVSPWLMRKVLFLPEAVMPKLSSLLLIAAGVLPILMRYVKLS